MSHAFTMRAEQVSSSSALNLQEDVCTGSRKNVSGTLSTGEGQDLQEEEYEVACEELLLLTWSIPYLNRHTNFLDLHLSNCSFNFWVPTGSLVPDPHKCSVSCTGELGHSGQHTHKLPHRPMICAGQRLGNTGDRECAYIQEKYREKNNRSLTFHWKITEPLHVTYLQMSTKLQGAADGDEASDN